MKKNCVNQSLQFILKVWILSKFRQLGVAFYLFIVVVDDYYDWIGDLHFAFTHIFSCVLLQLIHYVDVGCCVGLGRVGSGRVPTSVVGWVGLGYRKWTHDHVCWSLTVDRFKCCYVAVHQPCADEAGLLQLGDSWPSSEPPELASGCHQRSSQADLLS